LRPVDVFRRPNAQPPREREQREHVAVRPAHHLAHAPPLAPPDYGQPLGRLAQAGEVLRRLRATPRAVREAPLVRLDDLALDRFVTRQPRRQAVARRRP